MNLRLPHPYCGTEMSWKEVVAERRLSPASKAKPLGGLALSGQNNLLISP